MPNTSRAWIVCPALLATLTAGGCLLIDNPDYVGGESSGTESESGDGDGDESSDTLVGDGDGDPTTGDGDGDGDPTTGDGDGDPTTGDGDGDPTTGDGDGDGDGDPCMADAECPVESPCSFKKPNVLFILDYSSSMAQVFDQNDMSTRWEVVVDVLEQSTAPGSTLSRNAHLALLRFGHDPDPMMADTPIPDDLSGLLDGQLLELAWDDAQDQYVDCNGDEVVQLLQAVPGPPDAGIGTWTKGALDLAAAEIATTQAAHPGDMGGRPYVVVLFTDGAWTDVNGLSTLSPPEQNPAITAMDLFDNQGIPTYVVTVGDDLAAQQAADELAAAGGTTQAVYGDTPDQLADAVLAVVDDIVESVVAPACVGGLPRVMLLLDASSSMLNVDGGTTAGALGETPGDLARVALAGGTSMFEVDVGIGELADVAHIGITVFGEDAPPDDPQVLVQYGPCTKDNIAWALDPLSSCEEPGCVDPWAGPPITWTFADGSVDPGFDAPTFSRMPPCEGNLAFCTGAGTFTHLGLQRVKDNQAQYHADSQQPLAPYPTTPQTRYYNILITDGPYTSFSTDAQVQAELEQMFNAGITTFVVGYGEEVAQPMFLSQLQDMAAWGSGGDSDPYSAQTQAELELALTNIVASLEFDSCCALNDCSFNPEPTTGEADPVCE